MNDVTKTPVMTPGASSTPIGAGFGGMYRASYSHGGSVPGGPRGPRNSQGSRANALIPSGAPSKYDALGEQPEAFGRESAPPCADQCRHAWIVPAVGLPLLDELYQLALAQDDVGQVEAREFVLVRQGLIEQAHRGELLLDQVGDGGLADAGRPY